MSRRVAASDVATIGQVVSLARQALTPEAWAWAAAGAGAEVTLARNTLALNSLALVPRVGRDVSAIDTTSSFAGVPLALPVMLAPIGALGVYDPGDAASAGRAAAGVGTSAFCSMFSTVPWAEVAATSPRRHFFQIYVSGERGWQADVIGRVEAAGFAGLCVTMDAPTIGRRDRSLETGFTWSHPSEGTSDLDPSLLDPRRRASFTWSDMEWIASNTDLPVVAKGVMTAEDALTAVSAGARAVYVSNHGGRMVDQGLSTIESLRSVIEALPDGVDVAVDSGFSNGADVCKALALGARAVAVGRLQCWALAAGGEAMLTRTLELLRSEIEVTMANTGCADLAAMSPDLVRWSIPTYPPGH
jgi:isopentenyl diphosphate isomerase/L-lactate dehydrogenase-like FMN-dependent dehydrogenase